MLTITIVCSITIITTIVGRGKMGNADRRVMWLAGVSKLYILTYIV